jgi:hypothetical protein
VDEMADSPLPMPIARPVGIGDVIYVLRKKFLVGAIKTAAMVFDVSGGNGTERILHVSSFGAPIGRHGETKLMLRVSDHGRTWERGPSPRESRSHFERAHQAALARACDEAEFAAFASDGGSPAKAAVQTYVAAMKRAGWHMVHRSDAAPEGNDG